jgi:putative acetyltransferase
MSVFGRANTSLAKKFSRVRILHFGPGGIAGLFLCPRSARVAATVQIAIRPEQAADHAVIRDLTARAFASVPYSDGSEPDVIDRLRAAGALSLSLVAVGDGAILGHVALSPGKPQDGSKGWFALGPITVEPSAQRQGIGSALVESAVVWLRDRGAVGCVLVGDPEYYRRFGFAVQQHLAPEGQPAEYYQMLVLYDGAAETTVGFHPAFFG